MTDQNWNQNNQSQKMYPWHIYGMTNLNLLSRSGKQDRVVGESVTHFKYILDLMSVKPSTVLATRMYMR